MVRRIEPWPHVLGARSYFSSQQTAPRAAPGKPLTWHLLRLGSAETRGAAPAGQQAVQQHLKGERGGFSLPVPRTLPQGEGRADPSGVGSTHAPGTRWTTPARQDHQPLPVTHARVGSLCQGLAGGLRGPSQFGLAWSMAVSAR